MPRRFVSTAENVCGGNYCNRYETRAGVEECWARLPADWNGRCAYQQGDHTPVGYYEEYEEEEKSDV